MYGITPEDYQRMLRAMMNYLNLYYCKTHNTVYRGEDLIFSKPTQQCGDYRAAADCEIITPHE